MVRTDSRDFIAFEGSNTLTKQENQFSPDWLANLFDEDNLRCSKGDFSRSLTEFCEKGQLKSLENFLQTDQNTGLKSKDFEKMQREYGKNTFRNMKLTSLKDSIIIMLGDINLQFLLIAALVATFLEMTTDGWRTGLSEGSAIFIIVLLIFIAKYWI